jgi:hypothetical protein
MIFYSFTGFALSHFLNAIVFKTFFCFLKRFFSDFNVD